MPKDVPIERLEKQPLWIQQYISDLQTRIRVQDQEIEALRASVSAGPDDSTVFASVGDDTDRPLGRDVDITFKAVANTYTVSLCEDGSLLVDSVRDLLVEPIQTYSIAIHSKEN